MNARLKILQVTPWFHPSTRYGGIVETAYQLSRHAAAAGAAVRVLTTDADGPQSLSRDEMISIARAGNFEVTCCHRVARQSVSPGMLRRLASEARWADVIHLHAAYSFPTLPTMLAARLAGRPLVWMPHGALQRWSGTRRRSFKAIWESACKAAAPANLVIHVTSADEARQSQSRFPGATAAIIPNGVEIPASIPARARAAQLRLGYIGRLNEIKAIDNLIAACGLIRDRARVPFELRIAGTGEPAYEEFLRQKINALGIANQVTLAGEIRGAAKSDFFARSDVIVLPSHTENFGIVVAEALAHGLPVIASRGTPWQEVVTRACGLWVANDPQSLAGAIERIASMPLEEMGENGRRWMSERYSWQRVTDDLFDLYNRMITRSPGVTLAVAD